MQIIFRGKDTGEREQEYVTKFANPFPAAVRGKNFLNFPMLMYSMG